MGPAASFLWLTIVFLSYSTFYGAGHYIARSGKAGPFLQYALITFDATAITTVIYLTGNHQSPLYILYLVVFGLCIYHRSVSNFVFAVVLSLFLYGGLILYLVPADRSHLMLILGQLVLLAVLTGVLYAVLLLMEQERREKEKLVSRAKTLANIADVLSGSLTNARNGVKVISRLIEEEVGPDGLQCRITIHKSGQQFLPPSGGKMGVHIPIMVGDHVFGTMVVTQNKKVPLPMSDQDFFSSIARSLGLSLHRTKIWEDFQREIQRVEASLLLSSNLPNNFSDFFKLRSPENGTVDKMLDMMNLERGGWTVKKELSNVSRILKEVATELKSVADNYSVHLKVQGDFASIPLVFVDETKIRMALTYLVEGAIKDNPPGGEVILSVLLEDGKLRISVQDEGQWAQDGATSIFDQYFHNGPFKKTTPLTEKDLSMLMSKKIVQAHQGHIWAEAITPEKGRIFSFTLPLLRVSGREQIPT